MNRRTFLIAGAALTVAAVVPSTAQAEDQRSYRVWIDTIDVLAHGYILINKKLGSESGVFVIPLRGAGIPHGGQYAHIVSTIVRDVCVTIITMNEGQYTTP